MSLQDLPDAVMLHLVSWIASRPRRSAYCLFRDGVRALRCACAWTRSLLPVPEAHGCVSLAETVDVSKMTTPAPTGRYFHWRMSSRWRTFASKHKPYLFIDFDRVSSMKRMCVTCYCRTENCDMETFARVNSVVQQAAHTEAPNIVVNKWEEYEHFEDAMHWSLLCFDTKSSICMPIYSTSGARENQQASEYRIVFRTTK